MAKNWENLLAARGNPWNIPAQAATELTNARKAAETALAVTQNEATRTPAAIAHCRTAFEALTAVMRDLKRRYFFIPPLQDPDFIDLGLKAPRYKPRKGDLGFFYSFLERTEKREDLI
jgi:hypothetical protein